MRYFHPQSPLNCAQFVNSPVCAWVHGIRKNVLISLFLVPAVLLLFHPMAVEGSPHTPAFMVPAKPATVTVSITETQPQSLFNRGNYLLEGDNYRDALDTFRRIEEQGYAAGPLYYNMALSYIHLDSLGRASYYFQKSAQFRETRQQAETGLEFIEIQQRNRGTFIPYLPWYRFIDWFLFDLNRGFGIFWSLLLLNAGILVLLTGWLYRPNRWLVVGGGSAAGAGLILLLSLTILHFWSSGYRQAVVVTSSVPVQSGPEHPPSSINNLEENDSGDLAYEAHTVTLHLHPSDRYDGWAYIRLRNGVTGWVPESAIRVL